MHRTIIHILADIQRFLATTRAHHFMLYLPCHGEKLLDFLDSCVHQHLVEYIKSEGFVETALFTERNVRGHASILYSHKSVPNVVEHREYKNLLAAGLFDRAFCQNRLATMTCYVFHSNTLLVEADSFYSAGQTNMGQYNRKTGAEWVAACRAAMDGYYNRQKAEFTEKRLPHNCKGNPWCVGHGAPEPSLEWRDLFSASWRNPSESVVDMLPYRILNVLSADFQAPNPRYGPLYNPRPIRSRTWSERPDAKQRSTKPADKYRASTRSRTPYNKTRPATSKSTPDSVYGSGEDQNENSSSPLSAKTIQAGSKADLIDLTNDPFTASTGDGNTNLLNAKHSGLEMLRTLLKSTPFDGTSKAIQRGLESLDDAELSRKLAKLTQSPSTTSSNSTPQEGQLPSQIQDAGAVQQPEGSDDAPKSPQVEIKHEKDREKKELPETEKAAAALAIALAETSDAAPAVKEELSEA